MIIRQKYNLLIILTFLISILISFPLISQHVGINVNNPEEKLHLRTNESKIALRLDNKKSVATGLNYGTVIGTPIALQNYVRHPSFLDWTDLDHTKLVSSDNNRLNSPSLPYVPPAANSLRVQFDFSSTIPSTALITDVKLHVEWRRIGTFAGDMRINFILLKASNFQNLISLGSTTISSSTDLNITQNTVHNYSPITPDMLNLNDVILACWNLASFSNGTSGLQIDQLWLEVEYAVPATGTEDVSWTAGAKDGTFMISHSEDLLANQFLTINETGITRLKGLKITESAGPGKVLTSNNEGRASWQEFPIEDQVWLNKNDTAYLASGPAQINNASGDAALIFDNGRSQINNGFNTIQTNNSIMNIILDATHLCDDSFWEALEHFKGAVWASHSNCRTLVSHNRQFSDEQLKVLLERKAVIGMPLDAWMMIPNWQRGISTPMSMGLSLSHMVDHMDHICQIAGNSLHVGLGTDLDGGFGKEQCPADLDTIADLQLLPKLLAQRGYSETDILNIMHNNFIRFLQAAWA